MTGSEIEIEYNCPYCEASYSSYGSRWIHIKRNHLQNIPSKDNNQRIPEQPINSKAGLAILVFVAGMAIIYVLYSRGFFDNIKLVW